MNDIPPADTSEISPKRRRLDDTASDTATVVVCQLQTLNPSVQAIQVEEDHDGASEQSGVESRGESDLDDVPQDGLAVIGNATIADNDGEEDDDTDTDAIELPPSLCETCERTLCRYRCPSSACNALTCSVACFQRHKADRQCEGRAARSDFVPLAAMSDAVLSRDVALLNEISHCVDAGRRNPATRDSGKRRRAAGSSHGSASFAPVWPLRVQELLKQCRRRCTNLRIMPDGMKRHAENTSMFVFKDRCIAWRVEFIFAAASQTLTEERVLETRTWLDCLTQFLSVRADNVVMRHKLAAYAAVPVESLRVYMAVPFLPANKPEYYELPLNASIMDSLRHTTLLEYPTVHIALPSQITAGQFPVHIPPAGSRSMPNIPFHGSRPYSGAPDGAAARAAITSLADEVSVDASAKCGSSSMVDAHQATSSIQAPASSSAASLEAAIATLSQQAAMAVMKR